MTIHASVPAGNGGPRPLSELVVEAIDSIEKAVIRAQGPDTLVGYRACAEGWVEPPHCRRRAMLAEALQRRGEPYRFRGDGAEGAYDGWGLVKACAAAVTDDATLADPVRETPDWSRGVSWACGRATLRSWGLREIRAEAAQPGDVLLFDMSAAGTDGVHVGILSGPGGDLNAAQQRDRLAPVARFIHAFWARSVLEAWLLPDWRRRIVSAWTFDREPAPTMQEAA